MGWQKGEVMKYENPEFEIVEFEMSDVIITSLGGSQNDDGEGLEDF